MPGNNSLRAASGYYAAAAIGAYQPLRDSIQHMDQGGSLHQIAACCKLMNYGIRHKYANLGISLVMPLYCKLQWLIYYEWTADWSEEALAACFMGLSQLFTFTSWKGMNNRGGSSEMVAFYISKDLEELEPASTLNCQATYNNNGFLRIWRRGRHTGNKREVVANPLISPHKADTKR